VVVEELLRSDHQVIVLDDLSKGHRDAVAERAELVVGNIADVPMVRALLEKQRIDAVVHMAAISLVGESVTDPGKYFVNNVSGTLALLDAMRAAGVARFVFSSTAAVYGEPSKLPIDEESPLVPNNPYGETKLAIERALRWYDEAYSLRYVSLRYFNAAGASERCGERHDPETHLIPIVLQAARGERPDVAIYGDDYATPDGTCIRDYIHVVDLARAHVLALEALSAQSAKSAIFNLGCGGEGYSVKQLIDVARAVTGRPIPTRIVARRAGDPAVLVASSEKISRALGFSAKYQDLAAIIESAWKCVVPPRL
jgi:UDP-glucose 4-epimerase